MVDYRKLYRSMHKNKKMFRGRSINVHAKSIRALVKQTGARTLLDYGSGKGQQYSEDHIHRVWGGIKPTLYDIGVKGIDVLPDHSFDGVLCTDVMEHIAKEDVENVLREVVSFAKRFVYFSISSRPANKCFPDGTNVHLTVKPLEWWKERVVLVCKDRSDLVVLVEAGA